MYDIVHIVIPIEKKNTMKIREVYLSKNVEIMVKVLQ